MDNDQESYKSSWQEQLEGFYDMLRANGYSRTEARDEALLRDQRRDDIKAVERVVRLRRTVPLELLTKMGYEKLTKRKKDHVLWTTGVDSYKYPTTTDLGRYNLGGKMRFGWFLIGQERTDNDWCKMKVDGVSVASWEAVLENSKDRSLKDHLRQLGRGQ